MSIFDDFVFFSLKSWLESSYVGFPFSVWGPIRLIKNDNENLLCYPLPEETLIGHIYAGWMWSPAGSECHVQWRAQR